MAIVPLRAVTVYLLTEGPTVEEVLPGAGEAIRIKVAEVEVLVVAAGDLDGFRQDLGIRKLKLIFPRDWIWFQTS